MTAPSPEAALEAARSEPRWGLGEPLIGLVAGIMGATFGATVAALVTGVELAKTTLATAIGSLVGMWIVYAAVTVWASRTRGTGRPADDVGFRFKTKDLGIGVVAGLVSSFVIVNLVYVLLQVLHVVDKADLKDLSRPAEDLSKIATGTGFLVLALFVGIGAPIVEEVFFRGLLQPAAIRRFGEWPGIVLTAVVFGAVHFEPLQFPALAVFGLVLGVLARRTGRLGPNIVAHMVFNGLTLVALASR